MGGILRKYFWVKFEIDSPLAPSEAIVVLLRHIDPSRWLRLPFSKPSHEFRGEISSEGFKITRISRLIKTNPTVVIGNLFPMGTGTRVSVLIRPAIWPVALLAIFALRDFLHAFRILLTVDQNVSLEIQTWFFFIGFILVLLRALIYPAILAACLAAFGRRETIKAIPILEEIFQAHAVFKQAEQGSSEIRARKVFGGSVLEVARRFRVPLLWLTEAFGIIVTTPELKSAKGTTARACTEIRREQQYRSTEAGETESTQPVGALVRATFDLRFVRKSLALLSFCLTIVFIFWAHLSSAQHPVRSKDTGEALYTVLVLLNPFLYWCLGFRISTQFRRWIAASALGISVWVVILALQALQLHLPDPPESARVGELILYSMVASFITLAIASFYDDEDVETGK